MQRIGYKRSVFGIFGSYLCLLLLRLHAKVTCDENHAQIQRPASRTEQRRQSDQGTSQSSQIIQTCQTGNMFTTLHRSQPYDYATDLLICLHMNLNYTHEWIVSAICIS